MITSYNYAKFYERQRLVSYERMRVTLRKCQAAAEEESHVLVEEEAKKHDMVVKVDEDIDREEYNCEISEHIRDRIKSEAVLVKEKVKEIQKVVADLDKKIKAAKILEICAVHQKEEALTE